MSGGDDRGINGAAGPGLDVVQRWFQAVITHPGSVEEGAQAAAAQELVPLGRGEVESLIQRSHRLTAGERLAIYAHAYHARLIECLGDCFPVLARTLGKELFESFAFEYLQRYPSRSYTLDRLGEHFPRFLAETRPVDAADAGLHPSSPAAADGERQAAGPRFHPSSPAAGGGESQAAGAAWLDFLVDLAGLEWAIAQIFDGPGVEHQTLLSAAELRALGPERFAAARLVPVVCLRLLRFRYPVNGYYTAARAPSNAATPETPQTPETPETSATPQTPATPQAPTTPQAPETPAAPQTQATPETPEDTAGAGLTLPGPREEHVALTRTDFVVRRHALSPFQHALLAALAAGAPVGEAIAGAAALHPPAADDLAAQVTASFRAWTAAGFFQSIATDRDASLGRAHGA